MKTQERIVLILCLICVAFSGSIFSQDVKRRAPAVISDDADLADSDTSRAAPRRLAGSGTLERRVEKLERQVLSLTRDLEALRKEVKPIAKDSARPKPL